MTEPPLPNELEDYLFGRLAPAAGRRFEARLAQDASLRRHLREFEEGALALALAAPQLRPPSEAWPNIQAGIARERPAGVLWPVWPLHWLLRGWPLAGGLVVDVLIYVAAVHVSAPGQPVPAAGTAGKPSDKTAPAASPDETQSAGRENSNPLHSTPTATAAKAGSLASVPAGTCPPAHDPASPTLAATPLPTMPGTNAGRPSHLPPVPLRATVVRAMPPQTGSTNSPALPATPTQVQVDYVEFSNPLAVGFNALGAPSLGVPATTLPGGLGESISMVPNGNDLVVTIDPATLPANIGPVTIWVEATGEFPIVVGTVNPSLHPIVINVQNAWPGMGFSYIVTTGGTNWNLLGHFP